MQEMKFGLASFLLGFTLKFPKSRLSLQNRGHIISLIASIKYRTNDFVGDLVWPTAAMSLIVPSASANKALSEGRGDITHSQLLWYFPSSQSTLTFMCRGILSAQALIYLYIMWQLAPGDSLFTYGSVQLLFPLVSPRFLNIIAVSSLLLDISSQILLMI